MHSIATVGVLIEVSPWDDLQYYRDANTDCCFVGDRTPFRFRVAGDLIDNGFFFGFRRTTK